MSWRPKNWIDIKRGASDDDLAEKIADAMLEALKREGVPVASSPLWTREFDCLCLGEMADCGHDSGEEALQRRLGNGWQGWIVGIPREPEGK